MKNTTDSQVESCIGQRLRKDRCTVLQDTKSKHAKMQNHQATSLFEYLTPRGAFSNMLNTVRIHVRIGITTDVKGIDAILKRHKAFNDA